MELERERGWSTVELPVEGSIEGLGIQIADRHGHVEHRDLLFEETERGVEAQGFDVFLDGDSQHMPEPAGDVIVTDATAPLDALHVEIGIEEVRVDVRQNLAELALTRRWACFSVENQVSSAWNALP